MKAYDKKLLLKFLKDNINKHDVVFEFGSWDHTVDLCELSNHVFTVEHDIEKFGSMSHTINGKHITNSTMICVEHEPSLMYSKRSRYLEAINDFPKSTFSLVCIGKHNTRECFTAASPKVREGGMILVHNFSIEEKYKTFNMVFQYDKVFECHETFIYRKK